MADFKIRFNLETEDVELVLDDKVVDTVGTDVVQSWVTAYNDKHGFTKPVEVTETSVEETTATEDNEGGSNDEGQASTSED